MLRLCNPFAVEQQVLPRTALAHSHSRGKYLSPQGSQSFAEHTVHDDPLERSLYGLDNDEDGADEDEMDAHAKPVDSVRAKPVLGWLRHQRQQQQQQQQQANGGNTGVADTGASFRISVRARTLRAVEDEIYLLTLDLRWANRRYSDYEEQMLVCARDAPLFAPVASSSAARIPSSSSAVSSAIAAALQSVNNNNNSNNHSSNSNNNNRSGSGSGSGHSAAIFLCYECSQTLPPFPQSASAFQSPLVLVLRSTLADAPFAASPAQTLQTLLSAMAALQFYAENYQELPPHFDSGSPYNHNCLGAIDTVCVFADVLMAAVLKYLVAVLDAQELPLCCLHGEGMNTGNSSNSNNNNSNGNMNKNGKNESNNNNNNKNSSAANNKGAKDSAAGNAHANTEGNSLPYGDASFVHHLRTLLSSISQLVHCADEKTRVPAFVAYSHMLIKLCQCTSVLMIIFEQRCEEMIRDFSHYYDSFQELVSLLGSLPSCVQGIKMSLGNENTYYYIVSLRYWHACEQMVWLIHCFLHRLPAGGNNGKSSSGSAHAHSQNSQTSPYARMFLLWKEKVFTCLYAVLPLPSEFFFELQRMESRRQNVLGLSDDFLFDSLIGDLLQTTISSNKDRNGSTGQTIANKESSDNNNTTNGTQSGAPIKVDVMSFHARFVLIGMIRMLQLQPPYTLGSPAAITQHHSL